METNSKPLTEEEFVKYFFGDSYCMVGLEERQNLHAMLGEYAAQQVAAKDAEITRWKDRTDLYRESSDRQEVTIQEQDAEIAKLREELEAVKKERDSLKGTATKSWIALNFERHEHKKCRDQRDKAVKLLDIAAIYHVEVGDDWQHKYAALKRGLSSGETKPALQEIKKNMKENKPPSTKQLLVESIQKYVEQRIDSSEKSKDLMIELYAEINEDLLLVNAQLIEAIELLKRYKEYGAVGNIIWQEGDEISYETEGFLANNTPLVKKPASPWISVQDRLPELTEPMMWYNDDNVHEVLRENDHAIVIAYSPELGCFKAKYGGGKDWSEISSISIKSGVKPTHWMPLPAPPESKNE